MAIKKFLSKTYKLLVDFYLYLRLPKLKIKESSTKNLLIVRPDGIGDYILFRNFLSEIKNSKKYKRYKITFLANSSYLDLVRHLDGNLIKNVEFVDNSKVYYLGYNYILSLCKQLNNYNFDTILYPVFSRNSIFDIIIGKLSSREKISFKGNSENIPFFEKMFLDKIYTKLINTSEKFEFDKNKEFFEKLLNKKINLKNPVISFKKQKKENNYFVVNPGASAIYKRWKEDGFSRVIDFLIEKYDCQIKLIGSKNEFSISEKIKSLSKYSEKIEILCGKGFEEVISIVVNSSGVVSNETSTVHLAVALNKKVVCISNGNHYERYHPYPNYSKAVYIYPDNFNPSKDLDKDYRTKSDIKDISLKNVIKQINLFWDTK